MKLYVDHFILGHKKNLSEEQENQINKYHSEIETVTNTFAYAASQKCENMIISIEYKNHQYSWKDFYEDDAFIYNTDFGFCCFFQPEIFVQNFRNHRNKTIEETFFETDAKAETGASNGVKMILDAESFNYADPRPTSTGFKFSLHHHLDKPVMQFSSQFLTVGVEALINVQPEITYTTKKAIKRFNPEDRGCYDEGLLFFF